MAEKLEPKPAHFSATNLTKISRAELKRRETEKDAER